jgi:hypothetical protein
MATAFEDWRKFQYVRGRSATRAFIVINATNGEDAIGATGVAFNHPYMLDNNLRAEPNPSVVNEQGPGTYVVTWTYAVPAGGAYLDPRNPLAQPTRYKFRPATITEDVEVDVYGNPINNTARSPFKPAGRRTYSTLFLTARRYYSSFQIGLALQYMNKTNEAPFTIAGFGQVRAKQCLCNSIYAEEEQIADPSNTQPVMVCHEFEIRSPLISGAATDTGFKMRFRNMGRMGWYDDNGTKRPGPITTQVRTGVWEPVSEDVMLDARGKPWFDGYFIGEGETPVACPVGFDREHITLEGFTQVEGGQPSVNLVYEVQPYVDFTPLINAL